MDSNNQIQSLKSQIENMKLQIDNIEMQNNNRNMMNSMTIDSQIGELLLNLCIQMLNIGIQSFNTGKNMTTNTNKYYDHLRELSNQINSILSSYDMQQQMEMQQQMMQQQMMQQQMMQQMQLMQQMQMIEQNQMMQPMQMPQNLGNNQEKKNKIKIIFENNLKGKKIYEVYKGTKLSYLFELYIKKIYGITHKNIKFLYNGLTLEKNDQRKIEDVFIMEDNQIINVIEKINNFL